MTNHMSTFLGDLPKPESTNFRMDNSAVRPLEATEVVLHLTPQILSRASRVQLSLLVYLWGATNAKLIVEVSTSFGPVVHFS